MLLKENSVCAEVSSVLLGDRDNWGKTQDLTSKVFYDSWVFPITHHWPPGLLPIPDMPPSSQSCGDTIYLVTTNPLSQRPRGDQRTSFHAMPVLWKQKPSVHILTRFFTPDTVT